METLTIEAHKQIPLESVRAARDRISGIVTRTPLLCLNHDQAPADIFLKLENLQPTGAFKLRGACNAMAMATDTQLANGVYTASSGNMAQAVAWNSRRMGVSCTVVVPDNAPETKLAAVSRLGADIITVPFNDWWQVLLTHQYPPLEGKLFLHPSSNPHVMAGYGTIGLEILEDLPDIETVLIPWGSGGLACALGSIFRVLKPETKLYAVELDTGAPLAASFAVGEPVEVPHKPSFVDGISGPSLPHEMWPLASQLLDGSLIVTLEDIVCAIAVIADRNNVIAEGAGAAPVAAALLGMAGDGKIACIVTGGNLDAKKLNKVLDGQVP
jgi:threonine dehydratase